MADDDRAASFVLRQPTYCTFIQQHVVSQLPSKPNSVRLITLIAALGGFISPIAALAWGADGHRVVAELAGSKLSATARSEAVRLLSLEQGATLASVSTWADKVRSPGSGPLHYVNLPEGDCIYSRHRDCPEGRCVIEAIKAQLAILKSRAPDAERLAALKWVIHLVGDVHQPLHVGTASDKGGNLYQVRIGNRGSNLHAAWDTELVKSRSGGYAQLLKDVTTTLALAPVRTDPAAWAAESCGVRQRAGFYPKDRMVSGDYAAHWDAELVSRLSLASARLAQALDEALSTR